jgi:hypothetical protein
MNDSPITSSPTHDGKQLIIMALSVNVINRTSIMEFAWSHGV